MGWFGNKEELTAGDIVVRVPVEDKPLVAFTLDPDGAPRYWMTGFAKPELTGRESTLEHFVQALMNCGLSFVKKHLPGIEMGQVLVQLDKDGDEQCVVISGSVKYPASKWNAIRQKAGNGEMFAPRG